MFIFKLISVVQTYAMLLLDMDKLEFNLYLHSAWNLSTVMTDFEQYSSDQVCGAHLLPPPTPALQSY